MITSVSDAAKNGFCHQPEIILSFSSIFHVFVVVVGLIFIDLLVFVVCVLIVVLVRIQTSNSSRPTL